MPQLPLSLWLIAIAVGVSLLGLCGITVYAVLRAQARERVAAWPAWRILALGGAAIVPWLVVWFAPIRIVASIKGLGPLIAWLLFALGAFALLVLLPIGALVGAAVWLNAQRRKDRGDPVAMN